MGFSGIRMHGAMFVAAMSLSAGGWGATEESFALTMARRTADKPVFAKRQLDTLRLRYDLSDRPSTAMMSRGKPLQAGVRVRLPQGVTWESLGIMSAEDIRRKDLFPQGFLPLPHPHHEEGGMVFPQVQIDAINKQAGRDLTRFDMDFDFPDHFLPEHPPAMYFTTRSDLGDVSQGQLVTLDNFHALFGGILNPKQMEGLRLLLTPFMQAQFNQTEDRRSVRPSNGVACLDCHANGHTNAATHLVGDIRPQAFRRRVDTPSLRGVNIQRLFGSQRALKTVEDFTEFEQRGAYFDGDQALAAKMGVNVLERASQVHAMAEFQALLDFPPAMKLDVYGRLDQAQATVAERRGEGIFFGKGQCFQCHQTPYYTDNSMHNLRAERFYAQKMVNGRMTGSDGPIKTFSLRGIKDSPPYLHDGRLLTLEDSVEYFNLVLALRLTPEEKKDLVAFLKVL